MARVQPPKRKPERLRFLPQIGWIGNQVRFVVPLSEKDKLKQAEVDTRLRAASSRLPMWINRYTEVVNTAKTMACANQKLKWVLGDTDHCNSCLSLSGKVKRGKFWLSSGILPQSRQLECGGFNCQCSLQQTDDPVSRGPLPRLP